MVHALAAAVFADFATATAALGAVPEAGKSDEAARIAPWTGALRTALADPRLMHLDARAAFEERIAALLAGGWRPGHHLLLPAAIEVFGWSEDRRALPRLGHAGRLVDLAIEQRAMFQAQNVKQRQAQREALRLLRAPELPGERTMRRHIRAVRALAVQFPDLLGMAAPWDTVMTWLERCPPTKRELAQGSAAGLPWWKPTSWPSAAFVIFLLIRLVMMLVEQPSSRPPSAHVPRQSAYPDADAMARARRDRIAPGGGAALTDAQRAAIHARIGYRRAPDAAPGRQQANLLVTLDEKGFVTGIDVLAGATDPAFTAAAQLAIRRSTPFAPETTRMFSVILSDAAPPTRRAAPPPAQRGKAVPMARMAVIRARIDYRPGADVRPGEQRVEFEVRLDDKGGIAHMKRLLVRGDPAWADAVEAAIRSTGPFAPETARDFKLQFWVTVGRKPEKAAQVAPPLSHQ
jgi:hypothetical protein